MKSGKKKGVEKKGTKRTKERKEGKKRSLEAMA